MRLCSLIVLLAAVMVFHLQAAHSDIILDLDRSTPFVFEQQVAIPAGTTLSIGVIEVSPAQPLPYDRVGLDLYYQLPGDAAVIPVNALTANGSPSFARAGALAGMSASGTSRDLFSNPPTMIQPGDPIETSNLPPISNFLNSSGGVAYDAIPLTPDFPNNAGLELATWEFTFPTVGRVHFETCGILNAVDGSPTITQGNFYHDASSNTPVNAICNNRVFLDILPIPEPTLATHLMALVAMLGFCDRRNFAFSLL